MADVREAAASPDPDKVAVLTALVSRSFDPTGIIFSILLSWAVKQLLAWLEGRLKDKELGDE